MQLSREAITSTALEILRTYGLADVSMRRVATTLGVAPGALYWHIENKQELIASLAAEIVAPATNTPSADPEQLCAQLRHDVLAVRDGAEVVLAAIGQPDAPVHQTLTDTFVRVVNESAGSQAQFSDVRAAASGLLHLTLGAAAVQQSAQQLAAVAGEEAGVIERRQAEASAEHAAAVRLVLRGLTGSAR